MKKICFILSFTPDQRVEKRFNLFKEISKTVIYCNRNNENYINKNVKCLSMNLNLNNCGLLKRYIRSSKFNKFIKSNLFKMKDLDYLYVFGIDNLDIACQYKKKVNKNVHIIYEVADIHSLLIDKQTKLLKKMAQKKLLNLEKKCSKYVDNLVLTSEKFFDVYFKTYYQKNQMIFLPNIPDISLFNLYPKQKHEKFTIAFVGLIRYWPQIIALIEATKKLEDVEIILAGDSPVIDVEYEISKYKHVRYLGKYNYSEIGKIYALVDCIYCSYDTSMNNVLYALPNKLYESIYFHLPIIVSKGTYLSDIVNEYNIGVDVICNDVEDIVNKVLFLKEEHNYRTIIDNTYKCDNVIDSKYYLKIFNQQIFK